MRLMGDMGGMGGGGGVGVGGGGGGGAYDALGGIGGYGLASGAGGRRRTRAGGPAPFRDLKAEAAAGRGVGAGGEAANLASLFAPPRELMYPGTLADALAYAALQRKWVLVNVQDLNDFACHTLNRDVWAHEQVRARVCVCRHTDTPTHRHAAARLAVRCAAAPRAHVPVPPRLAVVVARRPA